MITTKRTCDTHRNTSPVKKPRLAVKYKLASNNKPLRISVLKTCPFSPSHSVSTTNKPARCGVCEQTSSRIQTHCSTCRFAVCEACSVIDDCLADSGKTNAGHRAVSLRFMLAGYHAITTKAATTNKRSNQQIVLDCVRFLCYYFPHQVTELFRLSRVLDQVHMKTTALATLCAARQQRYAISFYHQHREKLNPSVAFKVAVKQSIMPMINILANDSRVGHSVISGCAILAAQQGNWTIVSALLQNIPPHNQSVVVDQISRQAVSNGHVGVFNRLVMHPSYKRCLDWASLFVLACVAASTDILGVILASSEGANLSPDTKDDGLLAAARHVHLHVLDLLLAHPDISLSNSGVKLVELASTTGDCRLLNFILDHNALGWVVDMNSAFNIACQHGHAQFTLRLLDAPIDVGSESVREGVLALFVNGKSLLLSELLQHQRFTGWIQGVAPGHLLTGVLHRLLETVDVSTNDYAVLKDAARHATDDTMVQLLRASPDVPTRVLVDVLAACVQTRNADMLYTVLRMGNFADTFDFGVDDNAMLLLACEVGHVLAVEFLICQHSVDPSRAANRALWVSLTNGQHAVATRLLLNDNVVAGSPLLALLKRACEHLSDDKVGVVWEMLPFPFDNAQWEALLEHASFHGRVGLVERILQTAPIIQECGAINTAIEQGHAGVVRALVSYGAVQGLALESIKFAIEAQLWTTVDAVLDHLAFDGEDRAMGNSIMLFACGAGNYAFVDRLLRKCDVDAKGCLKLAIRRGYSDIAALLEQSATVPAQEKQVVKAMTSAY